VIQRGIAPNRATSFPSPLWGEGGAQRRMRGGARIRTHGQSPPHPNPLPKGARGLRRPEATILTFSLGLDPRVYTMHAQRWMPGKSPGKKVCVSAASKTRTALAAKALGQDPVRRVMAVEKHFYIDDDRLAHLHPALKG